MLCYADSALVWWEYGDESECQEKMEGGPWLGSNHEGAVCQVKEFEI